MNARVSGRGVALFLMQDLSGTQCGRIPSGGSDCERTLPHDLRREQSGILRVSIPPARPGGVALACGRHLPRPGGRPSHGPAGPTLPPVVHHGRPPPLRGVPHPFPLPGRRRLTQKSTAKTPRTPSFGGNLATRQSGNSELLVAKLPGCLIASPSAPWRFVLGGRKNPATERPPGLREKRKGFAGRGLVRHPLTLTLPRIQ